MQPPMRYPRAMPVLLLVAAALLIEIAAGDSPSTVPMPGTWVNNGQSYPGSPVATSAGRGGSVSSTPGTSTGTGSSSSQEQASGVGDPIFTGFDGRTFEFFGQVGAIYSLVSEAHHQLSVRLKFAQMWDHNGTYMEAFSFLYRTHSVEVSLIADDGLEVLVDEQPLKVGQEENNKEVYLGLLKGEMHLEWQRFKPGYGNAVQLTTETMEVLVWLTPAGTRDEGDMLQPSYLNFDLKMLQAPEGGEMEGVVGHTYGLDPEAGNYEDDYAFHRVAEDYVMSSFQDASHPYNLYGTLAATQHGPARHSTARRLLGSAGRRAAQR